MIRGMDIFIMILLFIKAHGTLYFNVIQISMDILVFKYNFRSI